MKRLGALLLSGLLALVSAVGCAPTYAPGYQVALDRGLAAKNAGRYDEAEKDFDEAANLGTRYKDRDEARLLQGHTFELAGKWTEAEAAYARVAKESGGRYQGVRAEFAAARLEQEHGNIDEGNKMMIEAVRHNPSSGLARHAVRRMSQRIEEQKGPDEAIKFLKSFQDIATGTDLDEEIEYEQGLVLFREGKLEDARDLFEKQARTHPYPQGALTDDAYYQAARIEEHLGHIDEALSLLREMLKPSEAAYAGSSYERPRFPEAQFMIARIYLDDKHDRDRAKKELRKMYDEHRPSRLTDDALWLEAQLEQKDGDQSGACGTIDLLVKTAPDSRYVRCQRELCPSASAAPKPCADYIVRELRGEKVADRPIGQDDPVKFGPAVLPQAPRPTEGE